MENAHRHWPERFLEALHAERDASPATLCAYRGDIARYHRFLARRKRNFANATRADIEAFLAQLSDDKAASASLARWLSCLRSFHRFLYGERLRADNPASTLQGPRRSRPLPKTPDHAQIARLFKAAEEVKGKAGARLRCMLELAYGSGLRVSELLTLRRDEAGSIPEMLAIRGKGKRERLVPLSEPARDALRAWIALRDADGRARASPWLFPSRGRCGHLTRQRFFQLLRALAPKAGIEPMLLSPHALRHAFATHLLAGGADLRVIQTLLGHADISATEIYTQIPDEALKKLVLERHPLARRGRSSA